VGAHSENARRHGRIAGLSFRFLADADLQIQIVHAVRRLEPSIDFMTADEAGLKGLEDPWVLDLAAATSRVRVSHDRSTMPKHFQDRLMAGRSSPGVLIAGQDEPIREVVDSIWVVWSDVKPDLLRDGILHLPSLAWHVFRW
jgi:hypothetical protein